MLLRHINCLFALILAPFAFAAADLEMVSFTSDKAEVTPYEPVTITMLVVNRSTQAAKNAYVYVSFPGGEERAFEVGRNLSEGWRCYALFRIHDDVVCDNASFAGGAEARLQLTLAVNAAHIGDVTARITSADPDPNTSNNLQRLTLHPLAAPDRADLAVTVDPPALIGSIGTIARWRIDVSNHGTTGATNLHLITGVADPESPVTISGDGWQCATVHVETRCTRAALGANKSTSLRAEVPVARDGYARGYMTTVFAEGNRDDAPANDSARVTVNVNDTFQMILVPLSAPRANGANGARWVTDVTVLARSHEDFEVRPNWCADYGLQDCSWSIPERNRPIPLASLTATGSSIGLYLYVREENAHKLHLNTRVYDESRAETTAGAEVPIVREREFSTSRASLLGSPLAREYRHTLRVYDAVGRGGTQARIEIFADDEETPRVSTIATLTGQADSAVSPFFTRPTRPAVLQIDPLTLFTPEPGVRTMRIDIEPVNPNERLWSFVSITNNETHHVTTISQQ